MTSKVCGYIVSADATESKLYLTEEDYLLWTAGKGRGKVLEKHLQRRIKRFSDVSGSQISCICLALFSIPLHPLHAWMDGWIDGWMTMMIASRCSVAVRWELMDSCWTYCPFHLCLINSALPGLKDDTNGKLNDTETIYGRHSSYWPHTLPHLPTLLEVFIPQKIRKMHLRKHLICKRFFYNSRDWDSCIWFVRERKRQKAPKCSVKR